MVKTLKKIWADGAYKGEEFIKWVKEQFDCVLEVVKKKKGKGFQVLPRRWIVERTFCVAQSIPPVKQGLRTKTNVQFQSCLCGFNPVNVAENI